MGTSPRRRVSLFWKIIVGLVALSLAWAVLVPNTVTEELRVEQCSSCFAVRRTSESGVRFYGKRLVDGGIVVEEDRSGATDLGPVLGDGHQHQWAFSAHHS